MSGRLHLDDMREIILRYLDDEWRTSTQFYEGFKKAGKHKLGGCGWMRVSLVLERLAADGEAEIKVRGRRRYFRRPQ